LATSYRVGLDRRRAPRSFGGARRVQSHHRYEPTFNICLGLCYTWCMMTLAQSATRQAGAITGDYALLDSGHMQRLEKIGPYTLIRPAPQALWPPSEPPARWQQADGVFERDDSGGGTWTWQRKVSREFEILFDSLALQIKLTSFGHLGLFPEQAYNWQWLRDSIRARMRQSNDANFHVLNLFAYTGGSTLAASQAGAHVVHVDAAKGVVDWARKNAQLSHLSDRPIRWLIDDAIKFLKRETRRGNRYHGIILDPPTFGRGPKGEVFKLENEVGELLTLCNEVLAQNACFVLYTCHTPGFSPLVLENQLRAYIHAGNVQRPSLHSDSGRVESGEMTVIDANSRPLPSGTWARWTHA
jgi:23S rRNA (cytosine1962-C5)-methyltransferase